MERNFPVVVLYAIHEMKNFGLKIQFGCSSFFWHALIFTVHIKGKFIFFMFTGPRIVNQYQ